MKYKADLGDRLLKLGGFDILVLVDLPSRGKHPDKVKHDRSEEAVGIVNRPKN